MRRWMILTLACLANCGVNGGENPAAGLVAHYRFAEGQGDRLLDHSGHQHHGRIIGARWEQAGGRWALRFNGKGDHIDFGDNRALKMNGDFTLLAWVTLDAPVYPDGNTNWTVFDCESYPNEGTILRVDGGATTVMFRSSRAGATPYQFGKARLANHGCYLIGVVRQGTRARIIVDGVADAEFACGGDPVYGQTSFKISSPSQSFAGLIHEARIYSRALTAGEIAGEYWRAAKIAGKDVSRLGTLALRGGVYADDPQVLAEVDFLGILPLADSERVVVSLVRGDGTVVREKAVESIPDACRGELALDMTGQPAGDYALTAAVRGQSGQPRAAASHVFAWPVSYAAKAPAPQTVVVPPLPAPRQRLQPQATVLPGGGIRVAVAGRQDRS
ncbi:MAG: LamG domain-containing protein, partial [Pirellulaceae bacterium]|nr:LamG domain-containing protein [Pirellulaceae bacterium]